jgi:hypothetical protein
MTALSNYLTELADHVAIANESYQASPVLLALHMGGVRIAKGALATLILTVIGFVTLVPLTYLWWTALGLFGG